MKLFGSLPAPRGGFCILERREWLARSPKLKSMLGYRLHLNYTPSPDSRIHLTQSGIHLTQFGIHLTQSRLHGTRVKILIRCYISPSISHAINWVRLELEICFSNEHYGFYLFAGQFPCHLSCVPLLHRVCVHPPAQAHTNSRTTL